MIRTGGSSPSAPPRNVRTACANGLLMESIVEWAAFPVEPYGLDFAPRLVARARERLPRWADRIFLGEALTWEPPHRFVDFLSYVALFSTFPAGPIDRFAQIQPQLEPRTWQSADFARGLERVVHPGGTAASAFAGFPLDQFPVAAKTGTAEIKPKQPYAWFVAYAPANNPQYVVAVMLEEGGHGGETAAPIARRILDGLFGLPLSDIHPAPRTD